MKMVGYCHKMDSIQEPSADKRRVTGEKRSRNGCRTCKIRRIKCDELKPGCGQCQRGKRKCDGYAQQSRDNPICGLPAAPGICQSLQNPVNGTSNERRSFDYFCRQTVPQLYGFFDCRFWARFILQASHHEPAILHAAVALGAVHEKFELGTSPVECSSQFALEQYMKSIRTFVQPSQNPRATDVALMILRGHHGSAIAHIESGAKILLEATAKEDSQQYPDSAFRNSSIPYAPLSSLTLIFVRLDLQASQILSKRPLYLRQESTDKESGFHSDIPPSFSSLEESRNAMDYLRNCVMRSLEPITQANTEVFVQPTQNLSNTNRKICAQNVKRWSMAFEAFLRSQSHELDLIAQQGVHMLKIHRIMLGMNLDIEDLDVQWTETAWDFYMPEFEAIISHAASILSFPVQGRKFSLEPGLVPALYFVATKCRHGVIRRKAIAFLSAARRQEGVWDSAPVAVVLERYVELEEAGLREVRDADDVPDSQRLSGIDARFDLEGRRAVVYYQRIWGPDNITKLDIEECIEW